MKTAFKLILLIGIAGYLVFAVSKFAHHTEEVVCEGVSVEICDSAESMFITADDVLKILSKHKISPKGQQLCHIDLPQIEKLVKENPYIAEADCFYTGQGLLRIEVTPLCPILHVIAQNGEDYYLDNSGSIMPVGDMNIDLCVATGNISQKFAKETLLPLAQYIKNHHFWNLQTEQIHVTETNEIELSPRIGQHLILLGRAERFEEKLNRVHQFYKNGLPKVGWNKYKAINAAFDGQIVCIKNDKK
ncbi:MAG: cell division protein FtsQ/DivIB [Bacteroidaceae bacterium]|nr:cell division protein FtsQ/DivIB [Bacteroidaceae bacterium]